MGCRDLAKIMEVVATTLLTSGSATIIASLFGIPLGAWLSSLKNPLVVKPLKVLVRTLYGLPPVVVGIWIYLLLSKEGIFSDLEWLFTINGMIMAQTVLVFPLVLGFSWFSFDRVNREYGATIFMTGASKYQSFWLKVSLARKGVVQGVALAFSRAIAEVGAVMMIGGNIAGQTRVMTTSILLETSKGELGVASILGIQLLILSMAVMVLTLDLPFTLKTNKKMGGGLVPKSNTFDKMVIEKLGVELEGEKILQDISMEINGGEIIVVLGESGSGKSTLLNALSGLVESSGQITGSPMVGPGGMMMVFQDQVALKPTVNSELLLPANLHNLEECGLNLLKMVGLEHLENRSIDSLSGGEKQRILFVRNLAVAPSLLLLDEFTSNLDGASIEVLEDVVLNHKKSGGAAIIVTHNILQAKRLADKILFLHKGELVSENSGAAKALVSGKWSG